MVLLFDTIPLKVPSLMVPLLLYTLLKVPPEIVPLEEFGTLLLKVPPEISPLFLTSFSKVPPVIVAPDRISISHSTGCLVDPPALVWGLM